ncbi:MAG: biopolymer transporter ExbD [Polyangiales bacterium]
MAIHQPGPVLLHKIPLRFVRKRVVGHSRKSVDQSIPLIPFIDFLIVLVIFLLMSFSASGELIAQQKSIEMPDAAKVEQLELAPVVSIDSKVIALDGERVADTQTQAESTQVDRIEPLIERLETNKMNWETVHSGQEFPGQVILQIDKEIDFRVIKKVMFSAALAGYANVSFAVNEVADK